MTLLEGKTATTFMRMCMTLSGLKHIEPMGMYMTRGVKASHVAKLDLSAAGVTWKNRRITKFTRIPLPELTKMYQELYDKFKVENQNVLRENITDYTGKE